MLFLTAGTDTWSVWRVQGIVERMGRTLTDAGGMLDAVLTAMEQEMAALEHKLADDARLLREVVEAVEVPDEERERLLLVLTRIEWTALRVAEFAHRPPDAEDQIDRLLEDHEPLSDGPGLR